METLNASRGVTPPVDETLRGVVVTYRLLVLVWLYILIGVTVVRGSPGDRWVLAGTVVLGTVWAGVTIWAGRAGKRLGSRTFVALDGVVALGLSAAGLIAGAEDFVSGGWPASWLFTVAFAFNMRWAIGASLILVFEHVLLHIAHELDDIRIAGTFMFIVFAVIVGWAFDSLRERERLRLELQSELSREREALDKEREATARHEERASLARHLHDEVLQTFHAIDLKAEEPSQVRYFVRRQTRELRRTIEEFRSPYEKSFRASLLRGRDAVEDLHTGVKINEVIRTDAQVTPALEAALGAAREAMMNAAKHSGSSQVDLYSEIEDGIAVINIRDRGRGFDPGAVSDGGIAMAITQRVRDVGGDVEIKTGSDRGTQVNITVPAP